MDINSSKISPFSDAARDTFMKDWPPVLRWALFLPIAFLGAIAAAIIFGIVAVAGPDGAGAVSGSIGWEVALLVKSAGIGAWFVSAGAYTAPRHQLYVAVVLTIIITMLATLSTSINLGLYRFNSTHPALHTVATIVGSAAGIHYINEKLR